MNSTHLPPHEQTPAEHRADHWQMLWQLAANAFAGVVLGCLVAASLIYLNVGGIGDRIAQSSSPVLPVLLIVAPFAFIFGGAVAASSIALLPYRKKKDRP